MTCLTGVVQLHCQLTVSDCRTRRYHPADLVGGARMCACCMHTCSLARVRV
ncbi:unnamed protein product, partial [Acanthoscelides obtectus]